MVQKTRTSELQDGTICIGWNFVVHISETRFIIRRCDVLLDTLFVFLFVCVQGKVKCTLV